MKKLIAPLLLLLLAVSSVRAEDDTAALYNSTCRNCHNNNGDGRTIAGQKMVIPDLRGPQIQKLSNEDLFQTIGNGSEHEQYPHTYLRKGMTESQVRQLVGYIRMLKSSK